MALPNPIPIPLSVEFDTLQTQIDEFRIQAGEHLDAFDRINLRDVRAFERNARSFWFSYAKALHDGQKDTIHLALPAFAILSLRKFSRLVAYRKGGIPFVTLQSPFCVTLTCRHMCNMQVTIAARMYWVEQRRASHLPVYIAQGRYTPLNLNRDVLFANLSKKSKWLVDETVIPTYEMHVFLTHIANVMDLEGTWNKTLTDIMDFVTANKMASTPQIALFTTPATDEAKAKCKDEGEDWTCDICSFTFDYAHDEELGTEPAVKTRCGHILGSHCLQSWVNSGHSTCPSCRQSMFDMDLVLPEVVRPNYILVINGLLQIKALDEQIDGYLAMGHRERFETGDNAFLGLVSTLSLVGRRVHSTFEDMYEQIQVAASILDAAPSSG
jgi:hypothetical protein